MAQDISGQEAGGSGNAVFMNLDDAYGNGLAKYAIAAFSGTSTNIVYNPQAAEFSADVAKAKAANPDAIAIIGFDETTKVLAELIKQGLGPNRVKTYLVDGNLSSQAYKDLPAGIMKGVKATLPGVLASEDLKTRLLEVDPALTDFSYAPESYDAVVLIALAAEQGGATDGTTIRDNLQATPSQSARRCSLTVRTSITTASLARSNSIPSEIHRSQPWVSMSTQPMMHS
jgi:branched-chain amino acid transport system substrate-binding protein